MIKIFCQSQNDYPKLEKEINSFIKEKGMLAYVQDFEFTETHIFCILDYDPSACTTP